MIVRHGTRYLNKMYIALMKTRLTDIKELILNSTHVPNGMHFTLKNSMKYNVSVF